MIYILIQDFSLLLVGLDKHAGITYKMRISFGQYEPHSFWVDKCNKTKHSFLLVWNPYILNWPVLASKVQKGTI